MVQRKRKKKRIWESLIFLEENTKGLTSYFLRFLHVKVCLDNLRSGNHGGVFFFKFAFYNISALILGYGRWGLVQPFSQTRYHSVGCLRPKNALFLDVPLRVSDAEKVAQGRIWGMWDMSIYVILECWDDQLAPPGAVYPCLKCPYAPIYAQSMWDFGRFWSIFRFSAEISGLDLESIVVSGKDFFLGYMRGWKSTLAEYGPKKVGRTVFHL